MRTILSCNNFYLQNSREEHFTVRKKIHGKKNCENFFSKDGKRNMVTMKDISTRDDIDVFIRLFYERVMDDPTIGIIFTQIVPIDWNVHIPLIVDFWETILLDNPVYKKNAMQVHFEINKIFPLRKQHFEAWLNIFHETIDGLFMGPITELAKKRAASIAAMMELKMSNHA